MGAACDSFSIALEDRDPPRFVGVGEPGFAFRQFSVTVRARKIRRMKAEGGRFSSTSVSLRELQ